MITNSGQGDPLPTTMNQSSKALFSSFQKPKTFQDSSSHRILWHMYEALNIIKNKNYCKSRDESFESS
jgi:hypothetical protein